MFDTNITYDLENRASNCRFHLSLQGVLSHRESQLLLVLTQGLFGSLLIKSFAKTYLFLGKSTAHSTGLLDTKISGYVLSLCITLLKLHHEPY